jgi:hypothetical protein
LAVRNCQAAAIDVLLPLPPDAAFKATTFGG